LAPIVRVRVAPTALCGVKLRARQGEKGPGFVEDVGEGREAAPLANDVEEVAVFGAREVGPFAGRAPTRGGGRQSNGHGPTGRIADVADAPECAFAATGGEVMTAD